MSGHCFQNLYYSVFKYNKKCLASVFSIVSSDVFLLFIYLFYFLQSTPNTTKTSHQTQILHKFTIHKFRSSTCPSHHNPHRTPIQCQQINTVYDKKILTTNHKRRKKSKNPAGRGSWKPRILESDDKPIDHQVQIRKAKNMRSLVVYVPRGRNLLPLLVLHYPLMCFLFACSHQHIKIEDPLFLSTTFIFKKEKEKFIGQ
jgi:hypothetical protein